jgi:hypothetical protein
VPLVQRGVRPSLGQFLPPSAAPSQWGLFFVAPAHFIPVTYEQCFTLALPSVNNADRIYLYSDMTTAEFLIK